MSWEHCGHNIPDGSKCPECGWIRVQWSLSTTKIHRFVKCSREIDVEVMTSLGHAVIGVEATATFSDGTTFRACTGDDGIARFTRVPIGLDGKVTYEDEDDLIARSFAANMNASLSKENHALMIQLLQSAVDFEAVDSVFASIYGDRLGDRIKEVFAQGEHRIAFRYLLAVTGLSGESQIVTGSDL